MLLQHKCGGNYKQSLKFDMLTHWSGPAKMGKSHFMSMEDHVLDQRMLVRTSLGGMLLVLTSNNSVTKASNTFTCERNFAATVKFSLSLSLRPSIPYGCNFTGEKKKKISRKWIEQTSNEFSEIS